MVLNVSRQIIFANRALRTLLGGDNAGYRGLRPGEALGCSHPAESLAGCGTTDFCSVCGASLAILASQLSGQPARQECRIKRRADREALDLRVSATPLTWGSELYTLFVLSDISHEKRRQALERIFFHDVLNTATALRSAAGMLGRELPEPQHEVVQILAGLVGRLIDEIQTQRQLTEAESGELCVNAAQIDVVGLLGDLARSFENHELSLGRRLVVKSSGELTTFVSDYVLVRRVLYNMLKNAFEASQPQDAITLSARASGDGLTFSVHNPEVMPRDVQLQLFQRSFSTKGSGRGLGTYSMRLLAERYLAGRVTFTSTPVAGTTFRAWFPSHLSGGAL
jgi:signal transduction histidine kinase